MPVDPCSVERPHPTLAMTVARVGECDVSLADVVHSLKLGRRLDVIDGAVTEVMIGLVARREGFAVSDAELQEESDRFRTESNLAWAAATRFWLQRHHMSIDDFEVMIERRILRRKVRDKVTEGRIERYFEINRAKFSRVELSEIVLGEGPETDVLTDALDRGEIDFAILACRHSLDTDRGRRGGYMGFVPRTAMRPELAAQLFHAKPGDILRFTKPGYLHLVRVEAIEAPELEEGLRNLIAETLFEDWLGAERRRMGVEIDYPALFGPTE